MVILHFDFVTDSGVIAVLNQLIRSHEQAVGGLALAVLRVDGLRNIDVVTGDGLIRLLCLETGFAESNHGHRYGVGLLSK